MTVTTGPAAVVVQAVRDRDSWRCIRCGSADWLQTHHRRPRGLGGTSRASANWASNLITLCLGCHERVESERLEAYVNGWLVPQHGDPELVPCLVAQGSRWVWLGLVADYRDAPPGGVA